MSEKFEIYDLEGALVEIKDRDKFYAERKREFEKNGRSSKKIKTVRLLLMNSKGRIFIQKRSPKKDTNPGLYDKTIGAHVVAGDTYKMTIIRECAEELGFAGAVLNEKEFSRAVKSTDLNVVGILKRVAFDPNFESLRITSKGDFIQPMMNEYYVGYYDGPIRFVDGEASGIEVYSLEELQAKIKEQPKAFTQDLSYMIKKFAESLFPIKK